MLYYLGLTPAYPWLRTFNVFLYHGILLIAVLTAMYLVVRRLAGLGYGKKQIIIICAFTLLIAFPAGITASHAAAMFYRPLGFWSWHALIQSAFTSTTHTFHASIIAPAIILLIFFRLMKYRVRELMDTIFLYVPVAHAIGDAAVRTLLDAFEATEPAWRAAGLRPRVEHAQHMHPDDVARLGHLGLVASMQPLHLTFDAPTIHTRLADREDPTAALAHAGLRAVRDYRGPLEGDAQARQRLDEALIRGIRQALDRQETRLQAGQLLFATVGSLAPFVGLFGTVWGIMNAFTSIAASANTSLAVVAPGIAEALFATALGLFAAIPATATITTNRTWGRSVRYSPP